MCRGQYSTLVLLQGSSKVAVGLFFFFYTLYLLDPEFIPIAHAGSYI